MDKRTKILRQIAKLDADTTVVDLRRQLSETRAAIDDLAENKLRRQAVKLAHEIEAAESRRMIEQAELERRLAEETPQAIVDLRNIVRLAHSRHSLTDPPTILRDWNRQATNLPEFESWWARGEALTECCNILRDVWRSPTAMADLAAMVKTHGRVLPELRHIRIEETEDVAS